MARNKILVALIIAIALLTSCRKIDTPNPEAKVIFGEWKYASGSGGWSGGQSDASFTDGTWVEYKASGKYKVYNGSDKRTHTEKFEFETREGKTTITYKNKIRQRFRVSGDTLFLNDDAYDAYSYIFVRK
jgi:hypothetical protein